MTRRAMAGYAAALADRVPGVPDTRVAGEHSPCGSDPRSGNPAE